MKKIIAGLVLTVASCGAVADQFVGVGYAPNAKGGTISPYTYPDTSYFTVLFAKTPTEKLGIGYYLGGGMTANSTDSTGSSQLHYSYTIFNAGATTKIIDHLNLYAGIGFSSAHGELMRYGTTYTSNSSNTASNINAGLIFDFADSLALTLNYDSAPAAIGFGIARKF